MSSEAENKPFCNVPTDGTCISINEALKLNDCIYPPGMCFGVQEIITDKHGHEVDGDWKLDKHGKWTVRDRECEHPDTPEYKAEHRKTSEVKVEIITASAIDTSTATEAIATVEVPKKDPVVPEKKDATFEHSLPMLMGFIGSVAGPLLTNFIKNFLKNKFKKEGSEEKKEEEQEEPTDCKTHQIKSNAKFLSFSKRLGLIEQKLNTPKEEKSDDLDIDMDKVEDLTERIEKLEKLIIKGK